MAGTQTIRNPHGQRCVLHSIEDTLTRSGSQLNCLLKYEGHFEVRDSSLSSCEERHWTPLRVGQSSSCKSVTETTSFLTLIPSPLWDGRNGNVNFKQCSALSIQAFSQPCAYYPWRWWRIWRWFVFSSSFRQKCERQCCKHWPIWYYGFSIWVHCIGLRVLRRYERLFQCIPSFKASREKK